jgi:hypothetical protein
MLIQNEISSTSTKEGSALRQMFLWAGWASFGLVLGVASGCTSESQGPAAVVAPVADSHHAAEHAHGHAETGPHHGALVELGNEQYHAELVHDEHGGLVQVYVLDGAAKKSVAIDAEEVLINLKHGGQGEQFRLAATPLATDAAGKSSCFASGDKELGADLDATGTEARLVVEIAGKSYTGKIPSGSHAGHAHDHPHEHARH